MIVLVDGTLFELLAPGFPDSYVTNVFVVANSGWELVSPEPHELPLKMKGGDRSVYKVECEPEDEASGTILFHNYNIKSNQDDGAKDIVVGAGTHVTYTAFKNGGTCVSDWTINGPGTTEVRKNTASIVFKPPLKSVRGWFSTTSAASEDLLAGVYTIQAHDTSQPLLEDSGEMTVVEVEITGFTPDHTYARTRDCPKNMHQSTCLAIVKPAGVSPLIYSIQGESLGATINETNGVVTPSTTTSGQITVRAAAQLFPSAYAEDVFLIKARPTIIRSSTVLKSIYPVGGRWKHTFEGTGGCLNGQKIAETITMTKWPFGIYNPTTGGSWTLSSDGTMTEYDYLWEPADKFDVNDFLPSPPGSGLPQSSLEYQEFKWHCPMCWGAARKIEQEKAAIIFSMHADESSPTGCIIKLVTGYGALNEPLIFTYHGDPLP